METEVRYLIGLDLGQTADYTALVVAERNEEILSRWEYDLPRERRPKPAPATYDVRHLERFKLGTSYPAIVNRIGDMLVTPHLREARAYLIVDATGVGAPVVDLLRAAQLPASIIAVTITGGDAVNREGNSYRVPKRDLISATKVLLQTGRLRFAEDFPDTQILVEELLNFQVKIDPRTAHDSYAVWREGIHDDLVLALAMACWYGGRIPRFVWAFI